MTWWVAMLIGLFIGANVGVVLMGIFVTNGDGLR